MRRTTPFVYTTAAIVGFFGVAEPASNFYPSKINLWGFEFEDGEAAFQAAKLARVEDRKAFVGLSKGAAKSKGRAVRLRPDWEKVKNEVMEEVVYAKFSQNWKLKTWLLATGDALLEERNTWNDRTWGTDLNGVGENRLGKILMKVRTRLRLEAEKGLSVNDAKEIADFGDFLKKKEGVPFEQLCRDHQAYLGLSDKEVGK